MELAKEHNFWDQLKPPIIGLAPMDGVTDVVYRQIHSLYGKPDVVITEFIPVEGIVRLSDRLLKDFWFLPEQRPVVAQIYGNDPDMFYSAAQLACELGFDGVDINMGCPAKSVVHRGCGAALIQTPDLAQALVRSVQEAVADWAESGINWKRWPVISETTAKNRLKKFIEESQKLGIYTQPVKRRLLPVSVKTRTGFREPIVEIWIEKLLKLEPAAISLHGRTLRQMYTGLANWGDIALGVKKRNEMGKMTKILGNGDIKNADDVKSKIAETGVDGVLIGRGTYGNPWIFAEAKNQDTSSTKSELAVGIDKDSLVEKFGIMKEHTRLHTKFKESGEFVQIRKNLAWYITSIREAAQLRSELVKVNSVAEVETILDNYITKIFG